MTEHEVEHRLRTWLRAEAEEGASAALWTSVTAIPDAGPIRAPGFRGYFGERRSLALMAAALVLATLLAAGALAVGSGLVRLPWLNAVRYPNTVAYLVPTNWGGSVGDLYLRDLTTGQTSLLASQITGAIAWSPDRSSFAYVRQTGSPIPNGYNLNYTLRLVRLADGSTRDVATPGEPWGDLSWSPDGTRIALATGNIRVFDVRDGSEVVITGNYGSLLDLPGQDLAWSPSGQRVAFASSGFSGYDLGCGIFAANADDSALTVVAEPDRCLPPLWLDDHRLAVYQADAVHVIDLTTGLPGTAFQTHGAEHVAQSPDRTQLAFVRVANLGDSRWAVDVTTSDNSGNLRPIVQLPCPRPCWDARVQWSPDGSRLLVHYVLHYRYVHELVMVSDGTHTVLEGLPARVRELTW